MSQARPGTAWVRNPVLLYLVALSLVFVVVLLVADHLSGSAARREAMTEARDTTELLAGSVVQPQLPYGLIHRDQGAIDDFDQEAREHLLGGRIRHLKIWDQEGRILYADQWKLRGKRLPLDAAKRAVLEGAPTRADITDPGDAADQDADPHEAGLVEVYTRVKSPEGHALLFELYFSADEVSDRQEQLLASFRPITVAGFGAAGGIAVLLLWLMTRRLDRSARGRERLLRAAVDASDAERRRIARDLHAGVLRELRTTSTSLGEVARDDATPHRTSTRLVALDDALGATVRTLRSMLLHVYPPAVDAGGLETALTDLVAPAGASGVDTDVRVVGVEGAGPGSVALVWRAAQEAVRNVTEHARCSRLEVEVRGEDRELALRVCDDGVGFVPGARAGGGTLGLRSLEDLVRESGGSIEVDSGPGRGTAVRVRVPR